MRVPTGTPSTADLAQAVAARRGASTVKLAGSGTEFLFYEATFDGYQEGYRIPRSVEFRTANNRGVLAETLQRQEMVIARWANTHGVPSALPMGLIDHDGVPVLVLEVVDDDGTDMDSAALGSSIAAMHSQPRPEFELVAQNGLPLAARIVHRLTERYAELKGYHSLPDLPHSAVLRSTLDSLSTEPVLNHLDLRRQNVRIHKGQPRSIFDWSNALAGPPELEFARVHEYSVIEENGVDYRAFLNGYIKGGGSIDVDTAAFPLLRLDTAVMLALVFSSVAPNAGLRDHFVSRSRTLAHQL